MKPPARPAPKARRTAPLRARPLALTLAACVAGLVLLHGVFLLRERMALPGYLVYSLLPRFDMDGEGTVPAYFSSLLLLAASLLLLWAASDEPDRSQRALWGGLGALFAFLSLDEAVAFHETLSGPMQRALGVSEGPLVTAWIVPAGLALIALGAVYSRFLLRLPRRFAAWFVAAGLVYVGGAVAVESLSGAVAVAEGMQSPLYAAVSTTEEVMELAGVSLFLVGLVSYLASRGAVLVIRPQAET